MSFSSEVKTELSKINNLKNKQEVLAEFLGYLSTANVNKSKICSRFSTSNQYNINRFSKLLSNVNINNYKIEIQGKNYIITFNNSISISKEYIEINTEQNNLKKAYIRGAFMGGGSINEPKNKYHLEIVFENYDTANLCKEMIEINGIKIKILNKEKNTLLYIKEGEEISKFLALIGANAAVLKFEEIRVVRDMKNNVNRIVNCETANLNKTINTSVLQINTIKQLKKQGKFNSLPDDLKEIANLRLENPNATLDELGNMLKKPIGKSTVSHRFKRLKEYL